VAARYVIGLTGNIATGKSLVLRRLEEHGAFVIDADKLAHEAMAPGTPVWAAVTAAFGRQILLPDGRVDRRKLGELVFADPEALSQLEVLVHPAVVARVQMLLEECTAPVAAVEAIKLFEAGLAARCSAIWVTVSSPWLQARRLRELRGLSQEEAERRIGAQGSPAKKVVLADVLLENDGSPGELLQTVDWEWGELQGGRAPGAGAVTRLIRQDGRLVAVDGAAKGCAVAVRAGRWWLQFTPPSRMPRLCRALLAGLEPEARSCGWRELEIVVAERVGYRQCMEGLGYTTVEEDEQGRGVAFRKSL